MSVSVRGALFGALAFVACAAPASATRFQINFSGTTDATFSSVVENGVTRAFTPGTLTGSFVIDTDRLVGSSDSSGYYFEADVPFFTDAVIGVDGADGFSLAGTAVNNRLAGAFGADGSVDLEDARVLTETATNRVTVKFNLYGFLSGDVLSAGGYQLPDLNNAAGLSFDLVRSEQVLAGETVTFDRATTASGTLSSITATRLGAVPEPLTWATMTLGFGAMGVVARRRRAALAA
jgi:hypothetical protein